MIFKSLPLHYRLKCKEVCKRWNELLMTRSIFRLDRHIYLNHCFIEPHRPPMTTFMDAKFPYDILTIDNQNKQLPFYNELDETLAFWRHLGKTVTEITIGTTNHLDLYKILFEMPQIRMVTLKNDLEEVAKTLFALWHENPEQKLPASLEKIKIHSTLFNSITMPSSDLLKLNQVIPDDAEVIIDIIDVLSFQHEDIMIFAQCVNGTSMRIPTRTPRNAIMQHLLKLENLPFKDMRFNFDNKQPSFDYIQKLLETHKNISDIHLTCRASPIPNLFPHITSLHLKYQQHPDPIRSLKYLESLQSLQILKVSFADNYCLFGHEIINLPKLKELTINNCTIYCKSCLISLASSFPNLEKFDGSIQVAQYPMIMDLLFRNWRYLKAMKISCSDTLEHCGQSLTLPEDQRIYLRTLKIKTYTACKLTADDFQKMSKVFPNLNTLNFDFDTKRQDLADVVRSIVTDFKELTTLRITSNEIFGNIPEKQKIAALTYFEPHMLGPTSLRVSESKIKVYYLSSSIKTEYTLETTPSDSFETSRD